MFEQKPTSRALFSGFILALIAALCTAIVLYVEHDTEKLIEKSRNDTEQRLLEELLPEAKAQAQGTLHYQCKLLSDPRIGKKMRAYIATDDSGKVLGFVSSYSTNRGYSNPLIMIGGVDTKGNITKIDFKLSKETPGIGDKLERKRGNYLDQFDGFSLEDAKWDVKKFGGDFDYITGATVTSRAVVLATKDFLSVMRDIDLTTLKDCKTN